MLPFSTGVSNSGVLPFSTGVYISVLHFVNETTCLCCFTPQDHLKCQKSWVASQKPDNMEPQEGAVSKVRLWGGCAMANTTSGLVGSAILDLSAKGLKVTPCTDPLMVSVRWVTRERTAESAGGATRNADRSMLARWWIRPGPGWLGCRRIRGRRTRSHF